MEYLSVEAAKEQNGLRLVLTAGVPGPWSEAAKALFRHHKVSYQPVRQEGGRENPELMAWTRHRNAPIAMYDNEAPRVRWLELLDLAERLGQGKNPSLIPADREARIWMVGLINEIAGEGGFAWNARLLMLNASYQAQGEKAYQNPMLKDYQYDPATIDQAVESLNGFLAFLAGHLKRQSSGYLVGERFSAADLYWAYFSNLIQPQDPAINPMPDFLRRSYELPAAHLEPFDDVIIQHRDRIFDQHLETPLVF